MRKERLVSFSDGIFAVIITGGWHALSGVLPVLLTTIIICCIPPSASTAT